MNANVVNVAVVDGKNITQTVELSSVKNGQPVRIKAVQGGKYILAEAANGVAPENITIKRVGKNLHIALEGSDPDQPQLIIEDFEGSGGQLVGVAEDGSYHEYISSDAEQDRSAAFLIEGVEAPQVLGAQPLPGFGDGLVAAAGIGWFWPALLGLAALGVMGGVYAATRDDDSDSNNGSGGGNRDKGSLSGADDNVGDKQGLIENGGSTDDSTPTFTGAGRPGTSVEIVDNGKTIGTAIVGEDGKWEYTPPAPGLEDGKHEIIIVPVDKNGDKGEPSPGYEIIVDTVAPSQPLIDGLYDNVAPQEGQIGIGGHTNDTTPTLSGTGEAGSIIHIYDNGVEIGTALANADGKWNFTPDPALTEGSHEFTVTAEDAAGNISMPSLPFPIIVDITGPVKPGVGTGGIDDILDNVGSEQGSIGDGDSTDDTTPTLIGSGGEPGDVVTIIDNGVEIGTAVVGEDGKWEFTPNPELPEGSHVFVVVITDPSGNKSEPSDPQTIIVDTTAPVAPTLDTVVDDQGDVTGNLASGQTTDDASPDLSGTAESGSLVTIYDNGVAIGSVIATNGNWTFTPTVPLTNGSHTLTATATDAAGNESAPTTGFELDIVAGGAPDAPAITSVVDDQGATQGAIGQNQYTDDAKPTINGTGAAGHVISVFANGELLGTTTVGTNGQWDFTPTTALAEGLNNLTALSTNAAGNDSPATGIYPINVDTVAPGAPAAQSLTDDVGAITGAIKPGDTTDDANPTFSGTAEAGAVVVIYDGANRIGSVTANASGAWSFTPGTALANGAHSFSAQAVDSAGNVGPKGPAIAFTVDTSAVMISITSVADNAGTVTGNLSSGQATDDTTPTLNGQATPGGIVSIYDGTTLLGTVVANASGQWTYTTPVLSEGSHNLTATVTTAAGGESAPTAVFETIIDTTAPTIPVIGNVADDVGATQGSIADGGSTDDTTPTLSGSNLQPGDIVIVSDGNNVIGSTTVLADGTWIYTPTTPLNDGSHAFTVVAVDPAGNVSAPSASHTVIVDTAAPSAPTLDTVVDDQGDVTGNLTSGQTTDDASPDLSGTAESGSLVTIYDNGVAIGSVIATNGNWTFTPTVPLTDGSHALTVTATDAAGNVSAPSASHTVIIDTVAPGAPTQSLTDDVGAITGAINAGDFTDDDKPTFSGTAEGGAVVVIYDGANRIGSVTANASGAWSFTPATALANGAHSFSAQAVDSAGNIGPKGPAIPFTVDTSAPAVPTITHAVDNVGSSTGNISSGGSTDDTTPTLHGRGEPGAKVFIEYGTAAGSWQNADTPVTVDASGNWQWTAPGLALNTDWEFRVKSVDSAGNSSSYSPEFDLSLRQNITSGSLNFDSMGEGTLYTNSPFSTGGITFTQLYDSGRSCGFYAQIISESLGSRTLFAANGTVLRLAFGETDRIQFDVATVYRVGQQIKYFAADGTELHTGVLPLSVGNVVDTISWTAPLGQLVAYIEFTVFTDQSNIGQGFVIDNIKWGNQVTSLRGAEMEKEDDLYQTIDAVFTLPDVDSFAESASIFKGEDGTDTLRLTGADQVLDLSVIAGKLESIEVIDLTGTGNNTLNLSLGDVLEQGEISLFTADDTTQMMIKGNAGDVVNLDHLLLDGTDPGGWATAGTATVAGVTYNVFQHSTLDAQLLVQDGVTTNLV